MKKLIGKMGLKKFVVLAISIFTVVAMACVASATVASPEPLLTAPNLVQVSDFGADMKATIPVVLAICIPAFLACWAIGFGIKAGLSWIMRAAHSSLSA